MSGHSKWSNIKRRKGAQDAKRSKIFTRIIKEINVAVKEGDSPDPEFNPRLRMALVSARGANMPKDTIERAIKKASEVGGADYIELNYEGYSPSGVALFVECQTDNQKRTVSNVRSYFNSRGGHLATSGSVEFMFDRKGVFEIEKGNYDVDELILDLIEGGAEEVDENGEIITVQTDYKDFGNMQLKLEELGVEARLAELHRLPTSTKVLDVSDAEKVLQLIDLIEEDDDVNHVFHNLEMTDELQAELEKE